MTENRAPRISRVHTRTAEILKKLAEQPLASETLDDLTLPPRPQSPSEASDASHSDSEASGDAEV